MLNFDYHIGTEIFFGRGQLAKLPAAIRRHTDKVLLCYGGGSVKRTGLLAQVQSALCEAGISYVELAGVEPNPRTTTVDRGAALCRQHGLGGVLAVGGGSTIDCAKVVAAGACYDGDPWDLVLDGKKIEKALPIVSVLTLAATGSEMDTSAVISDMEKGDKLGTKSEWMRPKASVLDPSFTVTVNAWHTAAGTADIMSHIFEAYFSNTEGYMQDRMAEGLLKTCIEFGVKAVEEPDNYEARANLMWASSWAINDFLKLGKEVPWSVHPMEHELSAYYDITHGAGLAILTPHWMRHVLDDRTVSKFRTYGVNVWGISPELEAHEAANLAIEKTADYFKRLGLPSRLSEMGIGREKFALMAGKAAKRLKGAYKEMSAEEIVQIFEEAL